MVNLTMNSFLLYISYDFETRVAINPVALTQVKLCLF